MSPEIGVADREMFVFRCHVAAKGDRWTFCVRRSALESLDPESSVDPALIFDRFRAGIYKAAHGRMASADPTDQHVISAQEIRDAG